MDFRRQSKDTETFPSKTLDFLNSNKLTVHLTVEETFWRLCRIFDFICPSWWTSVSQTGLRNQAKSCWLYGILLSRHLSEALNVRSATGLLPQVLLLNNAGLD